MGTPQNEWSLIRLGIVPDTDSADLLDLPGLSRLCRKLSHLSLVDKLVGQNSEYDNHLKIWSASPIMDEDRESYYLALPEQTIIGGRSTWEDHSHCDYPPTKFIFFESYRRAAFFFSKFSESRKEEMNHMLLDFNSGIGKTFCYSIHRLLHPHGDEVTEIPSTIVCWIGKWHLYHKGRFYLVYDAHWKAGIHST